MRTKTNKSGIPASVEKYLGISWGKPAPGDRIPVDTHMHVAQRDYKKQNVYKYIAKIGGVDWNLFGYATAVKRRSDGALAVINGQHRINLVRIVLPNITEVPAHIILVDDAEFETYGSKLFNESNGVVSKQLTNEELFYSQVLANNPEAVYMKTILEQLGLSCGRVNQDPKHHPVVYANFSKCLKHSEAATICAVELMKKGFKSVADDPLHGLTFLLSLPEYSVLGDTKTKVGKDFEQWFTVGVPMFHNLNDLKFKKYRANPSWHKGIAYGLLKSFAQFQRKNSKTAPPAIATIKRLYEAGFKEEDDGMLA